MPDYFPRVEFQKLGLSEVAIRSIEKAVLVFDTIERITSAEEAIEDATLSLGSLDARLDLVETELVADAALIAALDTRLDTAEADITALETEIAHPIVVDGTATKTLVFTGAGVSTVDVGTTTTVTIP